MTSNQDIHFLNCSIHCDHTGYVDIGLDKLRRVESVTSTMTFLESRVVESVISTMPFIESHVAESVISTMTFVETHVEISIFDSHLLVIAMVISNSHLLVIAIGYIRFTLTCNRNGYIRLSARRPIPWSENLIRTSFRSKPSTPKRLFVLFAVIQIYQIIAN